MKSKRIHIDYEGVAVPEIEFDGDDDEFYVVQTKR